ncbi:MAG: phosphotransferase [Verrucomicrobiales bacterium]|jgi:aminoglycoside/choline kinase family phosphotransferase|nr:phosphotransferase [Verrucomicrobiales bacterium]
MRAETTPLLAASREALGLDARAPLTVTPILKGGSDRQFARLRAADGRAWIVMRYGTERAENALFAGIAAFLQTLGVPVPAIIRHDAGARVLWMQDLGATDLHAASAGGDAPDLALYEATISAVAVLHQHGQAAAERAALPLRPGFDAALYAWERHYFYDEFLGAVCRRPLTVAEREQIEAELSPAAADLARRACDLVHRDFQSQNILINGGRPYFIDFQGMRAGTRHYDLASLLFDPYVNLTAADRQRLFNFAHRADADGQSVAQFRHDLHCAATQRLMQALGAYGFLGTKKHKPEFLRHIPRALANLRAVLTLSAHAPALLEVLAGTGSKF